ncbi:hypothetical protein THASP1DRAFT_26396 [Thamnocephalis sphaerospora]|uniref:Uncharacterized protein n=1 Tax=Thamnocephalis sphaerospora TaxID=78915 RepID=A0A4P9XIM8_9FUNG|nr:hypothetical protein THASP1DRAFT_26396 [Thamnocephalis sphaerospora]|eukprot:RKP05050.1 hypothetical protein THASP1DRAFT_26396 [Thamnocephalis sphaerospora]
MVLSADESILRLLCLLMQLALLSTVTAATFIVFAVVDSAAVLGSELTSTLTVRQTATLDLAVFTVYALRVLICLAVTGIHWPRADSSESAHLPLSNRAAAMAPVDPGANRCVPRWASMKWAKPFTWRHCGNQASMLFVPSMWLSRVYQAALAAY